MMKEYFKTQLGELYCGDALEVLKKLPSESVDVVITSPPYWCYSEDTEVLTWDGWKKIGEVREGELVMTFFLFQASPFRAGYSVPKFGS